MNQRIKTILQLLYQNRYQYMTAQEIAYATALSDRTVRKYIGLINEDIAKYDAVIEAKRGHGF